MSITDELRKWKGNINTYLSPEVVLQLRCELNCIADRIDAEHERAMADAELAAAPTKAQLEELGYIALPVDADGVPYHIDDKVDSDHYEDGTVVGIQYFKAPNGVVFEEIAVQPTGWDMATWHDPEEYRHHRAPTIEDVLREFADDVYADSPNVLRDRDAIVERYAAKLRLAEEVDE
jgi:hypothetical protein